MCFAGGHARPHLLAPSPIAAGDTEADKLGEVKEAADDAEVILCTRVCFFVCMYVSSVLT